MKLQTSTLVYLLVFLSLLTISHSQAQHNADTKSQQPGVSKIGMQKIAEHFSTNKSSQPNVARPKWFEKKALATKKRAREGKSHLTGARLAGSAEGPSI